MTAMNEGRLTPEALIDMIGRFQWIVGKAHYSYMWDVVPNCWVHEVRREGNKLVFVTGEDSSFEFDVDQPHRRVNDYTILLYGFHDIPVRRKQNQIARDGVKYRMMPRRRVQVALWHVEKQRLYEEGFRWRQAEKARLRREAAEAARQAEEKRRQDAYDALIQSANDKFAGLTIETISHVSVSRFRPTTLTAVLSNGERVQVEVSWRPMR